MTLTQWKRRDDLKMRLQETLDQPHVMDALSVLIEMGLPVGSLVADLQTNALQNAFNAGYFHFRNNLQLLCSIKEVESKPMPAPWQKKKGEAVD